MIHMTATETDPGTGLWFAHCRCTWRSVDLTDRSAARSAGDEHLAVANAPEGARA